MTRLRKWWRSAFDVRPGEYARTIFMALYFYCSLCAVYVLKTFATSFFLSGLADVKRELPYLYLLVAIVGGLVAYFYTRLAMRISWIAASAGSSAVMLACLALLHQWSENPSRIVLYAFAVWSYLLATVFLSQGWLIAANLFDGREAKRLYALLGLGAILGGLSGGGIAAVGARHDARVLLPIGGAFIGLAFASLMAAGFAEWKRTGVRIGERFRRPSGDVEPSVGLSLGGVIASIARHQHLLVIFGIIFITYFAETLVEYQFNVFAESRYPNQNELTAFLGVFNGVYVNVTTLVLQFFFTSFLIGRFGVGRTLLLAPATISAASLFCAAVPGLLGAAATRLIEASSRYSISKTAIELLYLPLPAQLKNRTKAFVDMFADRFAKGAAALLLVGLTRLSLTQPWQLPLLIAGLAGAWLALAHRARREYMDTVRRRVESRRLDLEDARISVQDTETVKLLEQAARSPNPRQVLYAVSLLGEAPGCDLAPLLTELAGSPSDLVRAKVYELARGAGFPGLEDRALAELRRLPVPPELARESVAYLLSANRAAASLRRRGRTSSKEGNIHEGSLETVSDQPRQLAAELLGHADSSVGEAVLHAFAGQRDNVQKLVSRQWLIEAASGPSPERRALAALAVGVRGDEGIDLLHRLLADNDHRVVGAALRAAGRLQNFDYLGEIIPRLADHDLRRTTIDALTAYGEPICDVLGGVLGGRGRDRAIRRHVPRVLAGIPVQKSVDVLRESLGDPDLNVREAVLKALGKLREQVANLDFGEPQVRAQIRAEAESYFQLYAALTRFREIKPGGKATALLARTIEKRLQQTTERLFRLLGLRYPPRQIRAAYLAVSNRRPEEFASALELLDNILEADLKHFLIPLFDGSPHLLDIGREQFGIQVPDLVVALRQQVQPQDTWLQACAVAAAGELRLRSLAVLIRNLADSQDPVIAPVARQAAAALA